MKAEFKLGFNHTYPEQTKKLILKLKPKVLRTYFELEDIKRAKEIGAEPYVGVRFMPLELSKNGTKFGVPKSWDEWGSYVGGKIEEFHKNKIYPKYYEIWNEPDRIKPPIFWNGTMEEYFMLYKFAYLAIREVDKDALIGGPEICHFNEKWIRGLIDFCLREKLELNFVSFHDFDELGELSKQVKLVRKWISKNAKKLKFNGEINIGEWGFRTEEPELALQRINYAEKAGVNFYCKDFFYNAWEKGSLLTKDFEPKPIYFALIDYMNKVK